MKIEVIAKKEVEKLYQWDVGRKLRIRPPEGVGVDEVHFVCATETEALVVRTENEDGEILADIPNILLQSSKPLKMYFFSEGRTLCGEIITIIKRAKPADYVYTETEVKTYSLLEKRILELEKYGSGENSGGGSAETWTVIYDTTLEEDVNKVLVTTDMNGNPYKAKKLRFTFLGTVTDARLNMSFGGAMQKTYLYQLFGANTWCRAFVEIGEQLHSGHCTTDYVKDIALTDALYTLAGTSGRAFSTRTSPYIESVSLGLQAEKYYTAGTRVIIEGVLES